MSKELGSESRGDLVSTRPKRRHLDEVGVEASHQHALHQLLLRAVLIALSRGQCAVRGLSHQESFINVL